MQLTTTVVEELGRVIDTSVILVCLRKARAIKTTVVKKIGRGFYLLVQLTTTVVEELGRVIDTSVLLVC